MKVLENECSFCGKDHSEVVCMVAGPGDVMICNECIIIAYDIITTRKRTAEEEDDEYIG